jgi:hypothetical protein
MGARVIGGVCRPGSGGRSNELSQNETIHTPYSVQLNALALYTHQPGDHTPFMRVHLALPLPSFVCNLY